MSWFNKFLPSMYCEDVYQIDYKDLKNKGIETLFFDLDNTILPYDIPVLPADVTDFVEGLLTDFKVVIVSNSHFKRVHGAVNHLKGIPFVKFSKKPLKFGFKKALKLVNAKAETTAIIGDQVMTDIYGGNRMKLGERILVYPVKKRSDHLSTKINRIFERYVIRRLKKKNAKEYERVLKPYVERK